MQFSERIGATTRVVQLKSVDDALKNSIWNVLYARYWDPMLNASVFFETDKTAGKLLVAIWSDLFHQQADQIRGWVHDCYRKVRDRYHQSKWHEVYDLVEFVVARVPDLTSQLNNVLETHVSAYRIIDGRLIPITNEAELATIEKALSHGENFRPVTTHLETALARLADRPNPDYRNSIKESISAVEALVQIITGEKSVLSRALRNLDIHPALSKGFESIYAYTSDASGIRHALLDEPTVDDADAVFFVVSCSAFINYLIAKSAKTNVSAV